MDEEIDPFRSEPGQDAEAKAEEVLAEPVDSPAVSSDPTPPSTQAVATPGPTRPQPIRLRDKAADQVHPIHIVDAVKTNEGASSSYIAYLIRSAAGDTRRRYSEFETLREVLGKLHPVLIIPPIPPHHSISDYAVKQSKAKEDASIIARRRRMLQVFLNRCNRHPVLSEDRAFLRFLDPHTTLAEIIHSPPVTLLPKNILRAPARDPTDTSMSDMYNALPIPSSSSSLQDPDQRFIDSEAFTAKFSAHLSGSLEKVNRRLMKRWTDLGADEADLGGLLNGFGLLEQNANPDLANAIEKTGQAIDSTYVHTNYMLQEWERLFTEPLAEYSQFSSIIKSLLKYRHSKHVQFEQTRDVLESKRNQLEEFERSEAEARRLDQALDRALNRVKPLDSDGEVSPAPTEASQTLPASQPNPEPSIASLSTSRSLNRSTSSPMGFLGALTHTLHSVVDTDPEASRRNNIGKTRELIAHLDAGVRATADDLRFASQTVQADLDRFQRQKVSDFKDMNLNFVAFHKEWCQKNIQQWKEAKEEIDKIQV